MLTFSLPFMLSNALQMFYNLVDMVIVGQYLGSPGLASVSISSQCHLFMTMICTGFCTGAQIYISQLIGKGPHEASACNAGDLGSIPGSGRSPGDGNGNPLQYSCLENSMDGGSWGRKEADMTE